MRISVAAFLGCSALAVALGCSAPTPETRIAFVVTSNDLPTAAKAESAGAGEPPPPRCPDDMVPIEGRYCIDRYEASLVEVVPGDNDRPYSPYASVEGRRVRAVSRAGVVPQGYISAVQAREACAASGKRLCTATEWTAACRGPENHAWSYGSTRIAGTCNDRGRNPVLARFGRVRLNWTHMNDPSLNQVSGTLAKTGAHARCTNGYGVFDMVGNLHEWVADPNGTFVGGYYQDVSSIGHGAGCGYVTTAHEARYHDYSTGFRCCADLGATQMEL